MTLVEFTCNNSHQATIGMATYEDLYGRRCRTPLYWEEVIWCGVGPSHHEESENYQGSHQSRTR